MLYLPPNILIERFILYDYNGLEDMVKRLGLTYDEAIGTSDIKITAPTTNSFTLPPGFYGISYLHLMIESAVPRAVKKLSHLMILD